MKIFIPTIEEWYAKKLEEDNLEEFKNFIINKGYGYNFHYFEADGKLKNVLFKWNPSGCDYPDTVKVEVGEIFMFYTEEDEYYRVIKEEDVMKENWILIE